MHLFIAVSVLAVAMEAHSKVRPSDDSNDDLREEGEHQSLVETQAEEVAALQAKINEQVAAIAATHAEIDRVRAQLEVGIPVTQEICEDQVIKRGDRTKRIWTKNFCVCNGLGEDYKGCEMKEVKAGKHVDFAVPYNRFKPGSTGMTCRYQDNYWNPTAFSLVTGKRTGSMLPRNNACRPTKDRPETVVGTNMSVGYTIVDTVSSSQTTTRCKAGGYKDLPMIGGRDQLPRQYEDWYLDMCKRGEHDECFCEMEPEFLNECARLRFNEARGPIHPDSCSDSLLGDIVKCLDTPLHCGFNADFTVYSGQIAAAITTAGVTKQYQDSLKCELAGSGTGPAQGTLDVMCYCVKAYQETRDKMCKKEYNVVDFGFLRPSVL